MSSKLYDTLVQFFEEDDWTFDRDDAELRLTMRVNCRNSSFRCYARVDEEKQIVLFYTVTDTKVAEAKRAEVAEFITRANYGMNIGNFEMDYSDGEVRYKSSVDMEGGELTTQLVDNLVNASVSTFNRYFPGLANVLFADMSPVDAIERIEMNATPSTPTSTPALPGSTLNH